MANPFAVYESLEWVAKYEDYSDTICKNFNDRTPSHCLWGNQNSPTEGLKVVVGFWDADRALVDCFPKVDAESGVKVTFEVLGGVDFPRFVVALRSKQGARQRWMDVVFRPWHPNFSTRPNPSVNFADRVNIDELVGRDFQFSDRMYDLLVESDATPADHWKRLLGLNVVVERIHSSTPADVKAVLKDFRKAVEKCNLIRVFFKKIPSIVQDVKLFLAQPIPAPPPWWLFGHRCAPGESQVDEVQDPAIAESGNMIERKFRRRHIPWFFESQADGLGNNQHTLCLTPAQNWDKAQMVELPILPYYVDQRHFEVIQHCILTREYQWHGFQRELQQGVSCNGHYDFRMDMFEGLNLRAQQSAIITIFVRDEPQAKSFPKPGTGVKITLPHEDEFAGKHEFTGEVLDFGGKEYPNQICILVVLPAGPGFVVEAPSGSWRADFQFADTGGNINKTRRAIRLLTLQHPNSWLTRLFLGHSLLSPLTPQASVKQARVDEVASMFNLNPKQKLAFASAVTVDAAHPNLFTQARQSICQGPPGTGKTYLIVAVIVYCLKVGVKVMITAASNQALALLVARLHSALRTHNLRGDHRIFHLYSEGKEDMRAIQLRQVIQDIPALPPSQAASTHGSGGGQPPSYYNHNPSANMPESISRIPFHVRDEVTRKLKSRAEGLDEPFGLNRYILNQIEAVEDFVFHDRRSKSLDTQRLAELVRKLYQAEHREQSIPLEGEGNDMPAEESAAVWLEIQKEILRRAEVVFITADSAGHRAATLCHVNLVIVDEASQLREYQVVNATARHVISGAIKKLALFGDQKQLGPLILRHHVNEFSQIASQGHMQRQVGLGQPYLMLTEQFRMHPHISAFVSQRFYEGRLTDHPSVQKDPFDDNWYRFTAGCQYLRGTTRHSVFLNVARPHMLYRRPDGGMHSVCNPHTAGTIRQLLYDLSLSSISIYEDVMVVTPYAEQIALLRRWIPAHPDGSKVDIRTADTAQGDENKVVIVDFVRPGPHMGFVADMKRLCVMFSRARRVLICVGSSAMGASKGTILSGGKPAGEAQDVLYQYAMSMHTQNAVFDMPSSNKDCGYMKEKLAGFRKVSP
ncbi:MAG: hypothetical protein Q9177_002404 [Variospora cf. flavescens]